MSDLHFANVEQRVGNMNKGNPHRAIIRDLDGSLTGLGKYTEVVGRSPIREADDKCQKVKVLGNTAIACERVHRRVLLGHSILAQSDHVLVTDRATGVSDRWFGTGVCQPPLNYWTVSFATGREYILQWRWSRVGPVLTSKEEQRQVNGCISAQ